MFELYPYQKRAVEAVSRVIREGHRRPLVVLPTGAGKTVLAAAMLKMAVERRHKGLFVVHRQELLEQASETIRKTGVPVMQIAPGGYPNALDAEAPLKVATVQTLVARIRKKNKNMTTLRQRGWSPSFIWWDEAHHCAAGTWNAVAEHYRRLNPKLVEVGLTATPRRNDGQPLGNFFDVLVEGPDIRQLINDRRLSDYVLYAPETPLHAMRAVMKTRMGDFAQKEQADRVQDNVRYLASNAVSIYADKCPGHQAIFFGASIAHSMSVAQQFRESGWPAEHVDGEMAMADRRRAIAKFRNGLTKVLCNYALISEGFDVPECSCVIFGRATKSLTVWLQACGRALRAIEGKTAVIIDQGWNWESLGKPDDVRRWSLKEIHGDNGESDDREPADRRRMCPDCMLVEIPLVTEDGALTCSGCGYVFEEVSETVEEFSTNMIAVGGRVDGNVVEWGEQLILPHVEMDADRSKNVLRPKRGLLLSDLKEKLETKGGPPPVNPDWVKLMEEI